MKIYDKAPTYTIREMKEQKDLIRYKVTYEIATSILELSLLIGCFYGLLMLLVESKLL
ncbi:hypothetical protein [Serpentinicella alkaliphila]|uniref:Uncharacterized protein n=1 Tax=Serpentinicella alkaliphila TaxID=1734049 RepID=A0A4R2T7C0_9FIRM|nr:hypothetical protein [Serpentinicella alkaliphila]QUH26112.1 hypothetical protein HZR23_10440 [Serpentinicella alkaliphila]TCP98440.1 hypothetical protein EDD79_104022 [Serpentinicella alkaliphila]